MIPKRATTHDKLWDSTRLTRRGLVKTVTVAGALPLVIVFLIMQRYIVEGVRLSGIKG